MRRASPTRLEEWALAVHLARWRPEAWESDCTFDLVKGEIDWHRFMEIVFGHQIYPIVAHNVNRLGLPLPRDVRARLRVAWVLNRVRAARLGEALLNIGSRLDASGIAYRVFKGPDLARRLYGDPALRHADDLDLLVGEADGRAVAALLQEMGFRPVERSRYSESFAGRLGGHQVTLDIHHGLAPPYLDVDDSRLVADLLAGGGAAPDPVLEVIALAVHLGRHRELLLKWVTDLDAFLHSVSLPDLAEMAVERAGVYRARRFVEAAFRLRQSLFGNGEGNKASSYMVDSGWLWSIPLLTPPSRAWRPYLGKFALIQSRRRMVMWLFRYPFLPPPDRERGTVFGDIAYRLRRERGRLVRQRMATGGVYESESKALSLKEVAEP